MTAEKYTGPDVKPGQKVAIVLSDGEIVEDTVHSVYHTGPDPEILKRLTGWRKLMRALTPRRFRKPLPVVRPYQPASTEVVMHSEYARRAAKQAEKMRRLLDSLLPGL